MHILKIGIASLILCSDDFILFGLRISAWRVEYVLQIIPGVLMLFMFIFLPETPKYYLSKNENEKAMAVLEWMAKHNKGKTLAELGITEIHQIDVGNITSSKYSKV